MPHTIQNNFQKFKSDFKSDTGLDAAQNMEVYIHYFNARMLDRIMQYEHITQFELLNKLEHLPGIIRQQMGEMIHNLKRDGTL